MFLYQITNKDNIKAFSNRKSDLSLKIIIIILLILFFGIIIKEKGTVNFVSLSVIFSFVGALFYFLFLQLKKLMWFLGKNMAYILNDEALIIQQNLDNETEMGFVPRYLYHTGKRKGGYRDVSINFDKMKSIMKNSKGDLILKTSSLVIGKVSIPRELDNLRDLENQLRAKIKLNA